MYEYSLLLDGKITEYSSKEALRETLQPYFAQEEKQLDKLLKFKHFENGMCKNECKGITVICYQLGDAT